MLETEAVVFGEQICNIKYTLFGGRKLISCTRKLRALKDGEAGI